MPVRLVAPDEDVPPAEIPDWLLDEMLEADHQAAQDWRLEGVDGQWEEVRDPDATAAQQSTTGGRPDFGQAADKVPVEDIGRFYDRAQALKYREDVILTGSAPVEVGLRALLDLQMGACVPRDHGGWYHVEAKTLEECMVYSDGLVYFYLPKRGYWRAVSFERILAQIQLYNYMRWGEPDKNGKYKVITVGEPFVQSALTPALRHIARHGDWAEGGTVRGFFDQDHIIPGLCMRDGFWTVERNEVVFKPHSPWHRARAGYDFEIPVEAIKQQEGNWERFREASPIDEAWGQICPVWHWLISSALPGSLEVVMFLQEFIAASLTGQATQYQKGAILVGPPGCGKSTVISAIEQLFPRGSVAHTDPSTWKEDYQRNGLVGKLLNTVDEALGRSVGSVLQPLKRCVTGETIEGRFLKQDRFEYRPLAGQLYSCNKLPDGADTAVIDRFELIEFRQRFRGTGLQVAEDRILERIRQELPGFILWVFHGWLRLAKNGRYTKPAPSQVLKEIWADESDIVRAWVSRRCEVEDGATLPRSAAFDAFRVWCDSNDIPPKKRVDGLEFKKRMNALGYEDGMEGAKRLRIYKGLRAIAGGGE